jgi:RNA polymerase sigma factor (sigma-70 family)
MPDDVLLKEIRAGQKMALEVLYTKYRTKFIAVLIQNNACGLEVATEIYQISVVVVYDNIMDGKLTTLNNENSLWNYIYVTGTNKYNDWLRKERRISEVPEFYFGTKVAEDTKVEQRALAEELKLENLADMQEALVQLGDPCTTMLELFYYEEKSMTEIAEEMNYNNRDTAKNKKYKCLKRLRLIFNEISKNK